MSSRTALACPFCHSDDVVWQHNGDVSCIVCLTCGAAGPRAKNKNAFASLESAVIAWNGASADRSIAKEF